jgi:hypothetical protein
VLCEEELDDSCEDELGENITGANKSPIGVIILETKRNNLLLNKFCAKILKTVTSNGPAIIKKNTVIL